MINLKSLSFLLFVFLVQTSFAAKEEFTTRVNGADAIVSTPNYLFKVKDTKIGLTSYNIHNQTSDAYISVGIDENLNLSSMPSDIDLTIEIEVSGLEFDGTTTIAPTTFYLNLKYNPTATGTSTNRNFKYFLDLDYHEMEVTVVDIVDNDNGGASISQFPDIAYIEGGISVERYYELNTNVPSIEADKIDIDNANGNDHIEFSWDYIEGAEEYDLEWLYIDGHYENGSGDIVCCDNTIKITKDTFVNNATRVRLSDNKYQIPLFFDQGYVVYRLRAVGRAESDPEKILYGPWSSSNGASTPTAFISANIDYLNIQYADIPDKTINWQYIGVYAENGKRKDLVKYADGTNRVRQTQTYLSSTGEVVASEQIYDLEGRPSVQVLPVPLGTKILSYNPTINGVDEGGNFVAYNYQHFDGFESDPCSISSIVIEPMDDQWGAANYYSQQSTITNDHEDFIPDAEGYPFVQTEYTNDNTGRVKRQGGMGADFQLDTEKATRHMYVQAEQIELDRLFGSDIGYAQHYTKEIVIDGNGQASVTYKDPAGRVIATALAGESPSSLEPLRDGPDASDNALSQASSLFIDVLNKVDLNQDSDLTNDVDSDLDNNHQFSTGHFPNIPNDGLVATVNQEIISDNGIFQVDYDLNGGEFDPGCTGVDPYPFVYDLKIKAISSTCGENIIPPATPDFDTDQILVENIVSDPLQVDYELNNGTTLPTNNLDVGIYTFRKELTVNAEAAEAYADQYVNDLVANGCIPTRQDFVDDWISINLNTDGCSVTCEECVTSMGLSLGYSTTEFDAAQEDYYKTEILEFYGFDPLGGGQTLDQNYTDHIENNANIDGAEVDAQILIYQNEFETNLEDCLSSCDGPGGGMSMCESKRQMMLADVSPAGQYGELNGQNFNLSVFNENNDLVGGGNWRDMSISYKDEYGNDFYVKVKLTWSGNSIISTVPQINTYDETKYYESYSSQNQVSYGSQYGYIEPQKLTNVSDFISIWEPWWAESLVEFHPEYCYYSWCVQNDNTPGGIDFAYSQQASYTGITGISALSSEQFDNLLMSYETYTEGTSTNPFGTDFTVLSNLISYDPYFINNGSSVDVLLSNRVNSYRTIGSNTYSLWEFAKATALATNFTSFPTPGSGTLSGAEQDEAWELYRTLYVQLKNEIYEDFAHTYAVTGGCYNKCIGNPEEFNAFEYDFWDEINQNPPPTNPWGQTPSEEQNCGFPNLFYFEDNTVVWFPGIDNLENDATTGDLQSQINNVGYQTYQETGQCPLAFELEHFLDGTIDQNDFLSASTIDLNQKTYFPPLMYEDLNNTVIDYNNPPGSAISTDLDFVINSPSQLLLDFQTGTSNSCNTTLDIPSYHSSDYDWNDYATAGPDEWYIIDFQDLYYVPNSSYDFKVIVKIDKDGDFSTAEDEILLEGSTCFLIGDCVTDYATAQTTPGTVSAPCQLTNLGTEIEGVFNTILTLNNAVAGGNEGLDFNCGTCGTIDMNSTNNAPLFQSFQENVIENTYGGFGGSVSASTNGFQINIFNQAYLNVNFTPSTDLEDIVDIVYFVPSYYQSLNDFYYFEMKVEYANGTFGVYEVRIYDAGSLDYVLFECDGCTPEFDFETEMSDYILGLVSGTTNNATDLPNSFYEFTGIPQGTTLYSSTPTVTGNPVSYTVTDDPDNPNEALCDFEFYLEDDTYTDFADYDFNAIGDIYENLSFGINGFTVELYSNDLSEWILFHGAISCLPVEFCDGCTEPTVAEPMSCESAYDAYFDAMTSLVNFSGEAITLTQSEFCDLDYEYYSEDYISYITNHDFSYLSSSVISIEEWIACRENENSPLSEEELEEAYDELIATLPITTSDLSFEEYLAIHPCDGCIRDYARVLVSEGSVSFDVASFCGYSYDPCEIEPLPDPFDEISGDFNIEYVDPCEETMTENVTQNANIAYDQMLEDYKQSFLIQYIKEALETVKENFTMTVPDNEYHYTLFYYDQAGNLLQTIPPNGVKRLDFQSGTYTHAEVKNQRLNNSVNDVIAPEDLKVPLHHYRSIYNYNALNQLKAQNTPDEKITKFWYDDLSRLVLSQGQEQRANLNASYTSFDALGRVVEVGELDGISLSGGISTDDLSHPDFPYNLTSVTQQQEIFTTYDDPAFDLDFRNRIQSTENEYSLITYDYDMHGNVKNLTNYIYQNEDYTYSSFKTSVAYEYDLVSGNVNKLYFNDPRRKDAFFHKYVYDADNRIQKVFTSVDDLNWTLEARYIYFRHGPLARIELGEKKVQGIDMAQTIHGWIKGVNSPVLNSRLDISQDGHSGNNINAYNAKDAYGYMLSYYDGDYTSRNDLYTGNRFITDLSTTHPVTNDLYNGNIGQMATALKDANGAHKELIVNQYHYDQLQRIKAFDSEISTTSGPDVMYSDVNTSSYYGRYSYDHNGNLTHLERGNINGTAFDDFTYTYRDQNNNLFDDDDLYGSGTGFGSSAPRTNQLMNVQDPIGQTEDTDLESGQASGNYDYDESGRLIQDLSEDIENITWTVSGKVKTIDYTSASGKSDIEFRYDALDRRIVKIIKDGTQEDWDEYFYARDAQGNVLGIYKTNYIEQAQYDIAQSIYVEELNIYGNERVGLKYSGDLLSTWNFTLNSTTPFNGDGSFNIDTDGLLSYNQVDLDDRVNNLGDRKYELKNHLGNVLSVITDERVPELVTDVHVIDDDFSLPGSNGWFFDVTLGAQPSQNYNAANVSGELVIDGQAYDHVIKYVYLEDGKDYTFDYDITGITGTDCFVLVEGSTTTHYSSAPTSTGSYTSGTITGDGEYVYVIFMMSNATQLIIDNIELYSDDDMLAFEPHIISYSDYLPFGMQMPDRKGNTPQYRYGFQGQEKDDEVKGEGNSLNYTFRMHDPRIGRFFTVDPLTEKYPFWTPYSFSGNIVINSAELEGLEPSTVIYTNDQTGETFEADAGTENGVLGNFGEEAPDDLQELDINKFERGCILTVHVDEHGNQHISEVGLVQITGYRNSIKNNIYQNNPELSSDQVNKQYKEFKKLTRSVVRDLQEAMEDNSINWNYFFGDYAFEGGADGTNSGTITDDDIRVGTNVIAIMSIPFTLGGGFLAITTDGLLFLSSVDELAGNSEGSWLENQFPEWKNFIQNTKFSIGLFSLVLSPKSAFTVSTATNNLILKEKGGVVILNAIITGYNSYTDDSEFRETIGKWLRSLDYKTP